MEVKIIRLKELCKIIGLSKGTIYSMVSKNEFPKPIKLNKRAIGWESSDINEWIENKTKGSVS